MTNPPSTEPARLFLTGGIGNALEATGGAEGSHTLCPTTSQFQTRAIQRPTYTAWPSRAIWQTTSERSQA